MISGGIPELPHGWAPTLLEPVALPADLKHYATPEPALQASYDRPDNIEDTRWLLESAQAEADGLCEEIRRLMRVSEISTDVADSGRTSSPDQQEQQQNQAQRIYRSVEGELVRLRQQHEELLEKQSEVERLQQAEILEQREALRTAQQRLRTAQGLGEAEVKARAEAERAALAAEESLGRLGLEVVRLREREASLKQELAACRVEEGQRKKYVEELKALRSSLAAERRRREDAEAMSRERLEEIRQSARDRKEAEESAEASRQNSQENWRKQRALERENRQLRERLLTLQEANSELKSARLEIEEARKESREIVQQRDLERKVAAQARSAVAGREEALEVAQRKLSLAEGELVEMREASAQLRQESMAESVASRALTTQLSLSENRIHELCRELVKAENTNEILQEGAQAAAALRAEVEQRAGEVAVLEANVCRLQSEQLHALRSEAEAFRSAELRGEAAADEARERISEAVDSERRRAADIAAELDKERGRHELLKRQIQDVTDQRDEVLARDQELRQQKEFLEEDRSKLWSELQQQCNAHGEAKQQAEHQQRSASSEVHEHRQRQEALTAELQACRTELNVLQDQRSEAFKEAQLQQQTHLKLTLELQELREALSEKEEQRMKAQSEADAEPKDAKELRRQLDEARSGARDLASARRKQGILHKQHLDTLREEHRVALKSLQQQHVQQLTVQQHMLDPHRLSTMVDDLLDEIGSLRHRSSVASGTRIAARREAEALGMEPLCPPVSHAQEASAKLQRMRQRLADLEGEDASTPPRTSRHSLARIASNLEPGSPEMPRARTRTLSPPTSRHSLARIASNLEPVTPELTDKDPPTPPPSTSRPRVARIASALEPMTSEAAEKASSPGRPAMHEAQGSCAYAEEPEVTMLPEDYEEILVPEEAVVQDRRGFCAGVPPRQGEVPPRLPPGNPTPIQRQRLHVFQSRLKQVQFEDGRSS